MNYQESIELLTSQGKFHINLGLERMQKLAELFDNPQDNIKIVHVAGTNGKGSTCAMLAKIFQDNGYKTGLYTSPHIKSYTERIKINFENIEENVFSKYIELIEHKAKKHNIDLTEFEILTMMAFLYFKDNNIDVAIMETGMGGRLDATNIIKKPILTVITSISLDHLDRLGKNIEEIAMEKSGISKSNVPVVVSVLNKGFSVVKTQAKIKNAKLIKVENNFKLSDIEKNIFSDGTTSYELSLRGVNQGENLALVVEACKYLNLPIKYSLKNLNWQSRFQYIKDKNLLVDAAHNPDAVKLLRENLDTYFPKQKRCFLFGVLETKDYKTIIKKLFHNNDKIYLTDAFAHNCVDKNILKNEILKIYPSIKVELLNLQDITKFINYDFDGIKVCCGSFYICAKIFEF